MTSADRTSVKSGKSDKKYGVLLTNRSNKPATFPQYGRRILPIFVAAGIQRVRSTQASMPSASANATTLGIATDTSGGQVFSKPRCENNPLRK